MESAYGPEMNTVYFFLKDFVIYFCFAISTRLLTLLTIYIPFWFCSPKFCVSCTTSNVTSVAMRVSLDFFAAVTESVPSKFATSLCKELRPHSKLLKYCKYLCHKFRNNIEYTITQTEIIRLSFQRNLLKVH